MKTLFKYQCVQCDKEFSTEPVRDLEEVTWKGEQAKIFCSPNCLDNHADKLGGNEDCWWD